MATLITTMSCHDIDEQTIADIAAACNLSPEKIGDIYACTPLQVATIAESTIHVGAGVFQFVLALSPSLDQDRFCAALRRVVSLNAVLRTRLVDSGNQGLIQIVTDEEHHTRRFPSDESGHDYVLARYLSEDKASPLGLTTPLLRTAIIGSKLVLTMHHAIMDHASLTPLFRDILSVYHGREPEKRAEFKEFVQHCLRIDDATARTFWGSRFRGSPAIFPRVESGYVPFGSYTLSRRISLGGTGDCGVDGRVISPSHVPSFIEAAWAMAASSYTGSDSVAFGLVLSGRRASACPAAETTLGPAIAIVPVQVNLQRGTTVEGILKDRAAARRQLQSDPSLQYGLTRIRAVNDAARIASGFQTLLNIRPRWHDPKEEEEAEVRFDNMRDPIAAFALSLNCDLDDDNGVELEAVVDPRVVDERQLARILNQFEHYLCSLTAASMQTKLEQIPRLSPANLSEILSWNNSRNILPAGEEEKNACLHELFHTQVQRRPTSMAVEAWDGSATYAELDDMTDCLARELRKRGTSPGSMVAFIFEKTLWTVVALLGIMKAGGACVPISTADPASRKASIISGAGIKLVLASSSEYKSCVNLAVDVMEVSASSIAALSDTCTDQVNDENGETVDSAALAFVIFTSGSTGLPKGVMLEHRNLASAFTQIIRRIGLQPGYRMIQFSSYVWDVHVGETFGALLSGGTLCIPSEDERKSRLAASINSYKADCMWMTPTVLRTLSPEEVPNLKILLSVGEPIAPDAARTWGRSVSFFNGWGPCESSMLSAMVGLTPVSAFPETIGFPVNCALWLVNPKNTDELVPIGAVGEILIDGPGVTRGYLKDDAKTRASFIKPPQWAPSSASGHNISDAPAQRRMYRTGDLARLNPDGSLCYIGRHDNQVKIRGQRLELGELESVLANNSAVRDVFTGTKIVDGRTHLVAIVSLADERLPSEGILRDIPPGQHEKHGSIVASHLIAIREHAQSHLPSYMVPTVWLVVEQMPRTISTKLDRVSLRDWLKTKKDLSAAKAAMNTAMATDGRMSLVPPQTPEEKVLQSVWASVLGVPEESIGRENCFVSLGGDSILAMHAASQCLKRSVATTTAAFLRNTPLAAIAEAAAVKASSQNDAAKDSAPPPERNVQVCDEDTKQAVIEAAVLDRLRSLNTTERHLGAEDVEAVVPATDGQATMLAVGESGGRGYYADFTLQSSSSLEAAKLQDACERVLRHHGILRTVFVRHGPALCQVVLKDITHGVVVHEKGEMELSPTLAFREGRPLACFHIYTRASRDAGCQGVRLEIHHALYDAMSIGLILRDLDAAYRGGSLTTGTQFHTWVSQAARLDASPSQEFWKKQLQGSSMPYLVPPPVDRGSIRGHRLDEHLEIRVPLKNITSVPGATPSSVVKTAWALFLSLALGTRDVVFGEVSANRYLSLPGVSGDGIRGPCVNQVPVRARLDPETLTLASLVVQMHNLHTTGMEHHNMGTRSIIRECTSWPVWTRFSTAIVYQNHASFGKTVKVGEADCELAIHGELGDSTDMHVIATPDTDRDELVVALRYSALTFSGEQIRWISGFLSRILDFFPSSLEKNLGEMEASLRDALGAPYFPAEASAQMPVAQDPAPEDTPNHDEHPAEGKTTREMVSRAWEELGLQISRDREGGAKEYTIWDSGADIVTALLLSEEYRYRGYDISPRDIAEHPTQESQVRLAVLKGQNVDGGK